MGDWLDNPKSIFDNMSDEEFENTLIENGFKYKKVERGNGGLIINGKKIERLDDWQNKLLNTASNETEKNMLKDLIIKIQCLMKHERLRNFYREKNNNDRHES